MSMKSNTLRFIIVTFGCMAFSLHSCIQESQDNAELDDNPNTEIEPKQKVQDNAKLDSIPEKIIEPKQEEQVLTTLDNISVKEIKSESGDCTMCSGRIVVSNGIQSDTIKGGSNGWFPNYSLQKINDKSFIVLDNNYGSGYDGIFKVLYVLSLNENNFSDTILHKRIAIYNESNIMIDESITNFIYENSPEILFQDHIEIRHHKTVKRCPESEGEICYTIQELDEIEKFFVY